MIGPLSPHPRRGLRWKSETSDVPHYHGALVQSTGAPTTTTSWNMVRRRAFAGVLRGFAMQWYVTTCVSFRPFLLRFFTSYWISSIRGESLLSFHLESSRFSDVTNAPLQELTEQLRFANVAPKNTLVLRPCHVAVPCKRMFFQLFDSTNQAEFYAMSLTIGDFVSSRFRFRFRFRFPRFRRVRADLLTWS